MSKKAAWQESLIESFNDLDDLCNYLKLDVSELPIRDLKTFPLKVPKAFADKMKKRDANDPLLKQVIHLQNGNTGFFKQSDPVGDLASTKDPGIIHKYRNRLLLITTGNCAIHCQYCFRQNYPYNDSHFSAKSLDSLNDYLQKHNEIDEIILSGGDPLNLPNKQIDLLIKAINNFEQIKTIRFHTRFPVVIPERIEDEFLQILRNTRKKIVFVFHINHPSEIDDRFYQHITPLIGLNTTLLNQAVMLKGINDSAIILSELSHKLFEYNILPYYLNQLDEVAGAEAFLVNLEDAKEIMKELRKRLSGYLVPKFVSEVKGEPYKTILV